MKPDIEMSDHQDAELWKDLFDEDSDMLSSDLPSEQRKSSSPNPSCNGTSAEHLTSDKQEMWSAKLARMYPALMIAPDDRPQIPSIDHQIYKQGDYFLDQPRHGRASHILLPVTRV